LYIGMLLIMKFMYNTLIMLGNQDVPNIVLAACYLRK
jgi:hypothetical protein